MRESLNENHDLDSRPGRGRQYVANLADPRRETGGSQFVLDIWECFVDLGKGAATSPGRRCEEEPTPRRLRSTRSPPTDAFRASHEGTGHRPIHTLHTHEKRAPAAASEDISASLDERNNNEGIPTNCVQLSSLRRAGKHRFRKGLLGRHFVRARVRFSLAGQENNFTKTLLE